MSSVLLSAGVRRLLGSVVAASIVLISPLAVVQPALAAGFGPGRGMVNAPATPQPPAPSGNDGRVIAGPQVVSGENFTLHSGDTLRGDLTVFGGNVLLEEGSTVQGAVNIFGGDADILGTVSRDLTVVGGTAHLRSSAVIQGNETVLGGSVERDAGAVVRGQGTRFNGPSVSRVSPFNRGGPVGAVVDWFSHLFATLFSIILITLLAIAVVTLFPTNVALVAQTVRNQWLVAGSIGGLTCVAVPLLTALLAITICLIPGAIVLGIAWALALVLGWAVIARIVGERLMIGFNQRNWTVIGQTALGAVVLAALGALPIIGWLVSFLAVALGLGAVVLTRAGTQPYPSTPSVPPASPQLPTPAM